MIDPLLNSHSWQRWSYYETDRLVSPNIFFFNMCSVLDLFKIIIDNFNVKIDFLIDHFKV